ncbi:hypothetical protein ACFQV2_19910 [Actinokineospora soli]|uniref:Uncharacterized protein n=1 Tax=Actinokineospora soli TaxID=1048753 RepID=A0ABW2TNQ6_9PSEU
MSLTPPALAARPPGTVVPLRRWIAVVTLAEALGFLLPAVVGALTADASPVVAVPALVAAGAVEGAALGLGQAVVLRRVLADLPVSRWVAATAVAASAAYVLGLLPSLVGSPWAWLALVPLPATIGYAQWLVLRRIRPRTAGWIAVTAMAWIAGLAAFLAIATPLWTSGQPVVQTAAVGAVAGLVMAAVVAAITGLGLREVLR